MSNRFKALTTAFKQPEPETIETEDAPEEKTSTPKKRGRKPGKRSNPEYEQVGVYIPRSLHRDVKRKLFEQGGKDLSDLASELFQEWVDLP